jgi:hypothetical protein
MQIQHVEPGNQPYGHPLEQPDERRSCDFCGAEATVRVYRDGRPRALNACDRHQRRAGEAIGGATLVRRTVAH